MIISMMITLFRYFRSRNTIATPIHAFCTTLFPWGTASVAIEL